ncbi:TM2 domain-containing protein [Sphingobacteriales bacterium UPWRP_1]|nr:hypothetical protein B6N25_08575 [Sphingobacteriales bacterium TSM_CSS]PSJ72661.1 TM2 domain-containing protein [Sphingobacteriales bacterium UPWRP_1]
MKQLFFFLLVCLFASTSTYASVSQFKVNDAQIDQLFGNSQELSTAAAVQFNFSSAGSELGANTNTTKVAGEKNAVVAFILAWFLGSLGIHRFYLGTKTLTGVGYILTCGGFGIVAFVDWVMLLIGLIDDDISKYVDNPKFFMWLD